MTKLKKSAVSMLALVSAICLSSGAVLFSYDGVTPAEADSTVSEFKGDINTGINNYFDSDVVYQLPDTVEENQYLSLIISADTLTVLDAYKQSGTELSISEYAATTEASRIARESAIENSHMKQKLSKAGIDFKDGEVYDTILSGFEITVQAKDFDKVNEVIGDDATIIVGEEYEPAAYTEVVTNDVDVYETGIFDSSNSPYQGDGMVIAVLDTGLDYTHSAFSVDNFTSSEEKFTLESVSKLVGETNAATWTSGLAGEDVYVSRKVPYAYDYADRDSDVFPINSEHGTHVAGVIAGKDDVITGVAPNAQLAIMKVFSDEQDGARTSWILAALEDCVTLGVDIINMSLGTSCGFSREVDDQRVNDIYDSIKEAGISLIAAASNDYNATFNSEKNGSNGLTSNPDSGTVGSPSTYDAALSVASVDGVLTPYLLYNDQIIYFNEASTSSTETKDFVDDILSKMEEETGTQLDSYDFEYVTISGVGRSSDYIQENEYYHGKIVLVERGVTTFEDKVRVALEEKGAAGIIIYNNVSGTISMSIGEESGAVCSISQDDGELLAASPTGIIKISRDQEAGPFMSDFSSWGPTSDLKIKPEITAHGGEIYSAVPGQDYDRLSGTSMAAPNQAGATAIIRQYVMGNSAFGTDLSPQEVTAIVNQLMMSTADIVMNKNGLPYAVRKQGAGLVNIANAYQSAAYITSYDRNGQKMDKAKLELGDDKQKTGVYEMTFDINNISGSAVTYNVDATVITEGVSSTYTSHSDTTVTMDGYELSGAVTEVTNISGGTNSGNAVTVNAGGTATVTVRITLSEEDKAYLDKSFAHGMYVEGFITLEAADGTEVDMNVPFLAFYGDWNEAPVFDEEYYDTNADEINAGLDEEDKLMADAYATRVVGGLYSDYIATLGTYYFVQDPSATQIAADKDHIAISNQMDGGNSAVNSIRYIWAGLLRNAKEVNISIVEDSTGKEVFNRTEYNQYKSHYTNGMIYYSSIETEFSAIENELKNNTQYTVTVTAYIDYGTKEEQDATNVRNTFTFPLYVDFEAPTLTDVTFRSEYDRTSRTTTYYADLSIYDNHYAMAVQAGQVTYDDGFYLSTFGKYLTPVYSSFNSTSTVTIELTDYIEQIKQSDGITYYPDGTYQLNQDNNSFIAICYDYAMNSSMYEIELPDEVLSLAFGQETVNLSPNETLNLGAVDSILNITSAGDDDAWIQMLEFSSDNPDIAEVINHTILAKASGDAVITATGYNEDGEPVSASVRIHVLSSEEEGYNGGYTVPEVNSFSLTGYTVNKAYYSVSSDEREIGVTGGSYDFGGDYTLSMFPSESVTLSYSLDSYFPDQTAVAFSVGNSNIVTVDETGTIVAQTEGTTIVTVRVTYNGSNTLYSARVTITVKDPFTTNSIYLMSYKGLGGEVVIPDDRGITTIYSYAFSGYEYVEKDLAAGDVINEEDPYYIKQQYIGDDTITRIVIPEGVTDIQSYAFAGLTALEEVVLPDSLNRIGVGAFLGCTSLKSIVNLEAVKFINQEAFRNTALEELNFGNIVAIGNYAFADSALTYLELPASCQSLGEGAFYNNAALASVNFAATRTKLGSYVFAECPLLVSINVNAAVIPSYSFYNCSALSRVTLGRDVSVIGEYAFAGTAVASFTIDSRNNVLSAEEGGAFIYNGDQLVLVAPEFRGNGTSITTDAVTIAAGAFAGNTKLFSVYAPNATHVGAYAFANCTNLWSVTLPNVEVIEDYAFYNTALGSTPDLSGVSYIGAYAFAATDITSVTIADNSSVGDYAFYGCNSLESVVIGNNVTVGNAAFYCPVLLLTYENTGVLNYYTSYGYTVTDTTTGETATLTFYRYNFGAGVLSSLQSLVIGNNAVIGDYAFAGNAYLASATLGSGAQIGAYAFYDDASLSSVDLSEALSVGAFAFSGSQIADKWEFQGTIMDAAELTLTDNTLYAGETIYNAFAPALVQVNLSSATSVGDGAFAFNNALTSVTFGANLQALSGYAFAYCKALESVSFPAGLSAIGDYAFFGTALTSADLSGVSSVGSYSFAQTPLKSVTLKTGATIGDGAFAEDYGLASAGNLGNLNSIGAYAFAGTALQQVSFENVVSIGDFAFAQSALTDVTFSAAIQSLGENPFYGCNIQAFALETAEVADEGVAATDATSNTVSIIDGVLYQQVPNGLELVSYPAAKAGSSYTVEEGTVRISARAFQSAQLSTVTLPISLAAIGDKAFYGCGNLAIVVFRSYQAPVLEEQYDSSYALSLQNLPFDDYFNGYQGLGIVKYYMWNITTNLSGFYYGANFVDYIGHNDGSLTIVKPVNGQGYSTFIFGQYFGQTIEGASAATEATLNVIALIAALPESTAITLSDQAQVEAARAAYNQISTLEQQALVTNYSKLTAAENMIEYLLNRDNPETDPPTHGPEPDDGGNFFADNMWGLIIAGVLLLAVVGLVVYIVILKRNNKRSA